MGSPIRLFLQVLCYGAFALVIGYFSANPAYQHNDQGQALIKLSFSHAGEHVRECVPFSQGENLHRAPNMQMSMNCPRERIPLQVEVLLDGKELFRGELPPTGIARDGESYIYRRFIVSPGTHTLTARLRDSRREQGFDHERSEEIHLSPQQNFVIDFTLAQGGFVFL